MAQPNEPQVLPARVVTDDDLGSIRPSTALFAPTPEDAVVMTLEQEQFAQEVLTAKQRLFCYAFCRTGTLAGAVGLLTDEATGKPICSIGNHKKWMANDQSYRSFHEELAQAVDAKWETKLLAAADRGMIEHKYDGQGALVHKVVRQDPKLLLSVVAARHPLYRQDKGANTVTVVVVRTDE